MAYVGAEVGVSIITVDPQSLDKAEPAGAYSVFTPVQETGAVAEVAQYEFTGQILNFKSEAQ